MRATPGHRVPLRRQPLGVWLALAVLVIISILVGCSAMGGWDIWWHLKTGELAFTRLSTLPVDEFSLTRAGEPWIHKDLAADVFFYLVHRLAGESGLAALKLAFSVAILLLIVALVRRLTKRPSLWILLSGLAFFIVQFRIIVRPESFSLLLFLSFLLLIEDHRCLGDATEQIGADPEPGTAPALSGDVTSASGRSGFRWPSRLRLGWQLWALVLGQWLWANLHRGAMLGLVLIWVYSLATWLKRVVHLRSVDSAKARTRSGQGATRRAIATSLAAILATLATCLNPSGLGLFALSFRVTANSTLSRIISEWKPLGLLELIEAFPLASAWMAALMILILLVLALRRYRALGLWHIGLAMVFVAWGFKAPRMLPYMAMGTAPLMATSWDALLDGRPRLDALAARLRGGGLLASALVLLIGVLTRSVGMPAWGWDESAYPERAVRLLLERPVHGEGLTTYTFAGYLIYHAWPDKHVLCDGRYDTVYPDEVILACMGAEQDPDLLDTLRRRYSLQWVLAHNRPGRSRDPDQPRAFDYLDVDEDWALVHWDRSSLLYVWRNGVNGDLANELAYRYLRPHDPDVALFESLRRVQGDPGRLADLEAEVRRLYRDATGDYRAVIVMALYLHQVGQRGEPLRWVTEELGNLRDADPQAVDRVLRFIGH